MVWPGAAAKAKREGGQMSTNWCRNSELVRIKVTEEDGDHRENELRCRDTAGCLH